MEHLRQYRKGLILAIFSGVLIFSGCFGDVDLTGFLYSSVGVNKRFQESMEYNMTINTPDVIQLDSSVYSIMAIGDVHVGTTENLKLFLNLAIQPEASFFTIAGDLTSGKEKDMVIMSEFLDGNARIPYFSVTGNHDLFFEGWPSFLKHFGSSSYVRYIQSTDVSDMFIFLDSGSATLGKDQSDWLENLLIEHRKNHRYCIIVTHTNLFRSRRTTSTNPLVDELYFLMDLFAEHKVDLVITGHDHRRSEERLGPTTFITLDALEDGYKHASYLQLKVSDEALSWEFFPINP